MHHLTGDIHALPVHSAQTIGHSAAARKVGEFAAQVKPILAKLPIEFEQMLSSDLFHRQQIGYSIES